MLSIEDGVLAYALEGSSRPHPCLAGLNLKPEFFQPAEGGYCHIRKFAIFMLMITSSKTPFYS